MKKNSDMTAKQWSDAFGKAFVFSRFCRQTSWTISYRSSTASLELALSQNPEWRLFLDSPKELAINSPLQQRLRNHVARARVYPNGSLLLPDPDLRWESLTPFDLITLTITGSDSVKSWRAEIGLKDYSEELIWNKLDIKFKPTSKTQAYAETVREVSGSYTLAPNCGMAFRSRYKKQNDIASLVSHWLFVWHLLIVGQQKRNGGLLLSGS